MKKIISISLFVVMFVLIGFIVWKFVFKKKEKMLTLSEMVAQTRFAPLNSEDLLASISTNGKPTIVMHFGTECEYCQQEIKEITATPEDFEQSNIIMVTVQDTSAIRKFETTFHLKDFSFIHLYHDSDGGFVRIFSIKKMPALVIYDAEGNFTTSFAGLQKTSNVLQYLK